MHNVASSVRSLFMAAKGVLQICNIRCVARKIKDSFCYLNLAGLWNRISSDLKF